MIEGWKGGQEQLLDEVYTNKRAAGFLGDKWAGAAEWQCQLGKEGFSRFGGQTLYCI